MAVSSIDNSCIFLCSSIWEIAEMLEISKKIILFTFEKKQDILTDEYKNIVDELTSRFQNKVTKRNRGLLKN
jgi:hypothetical protein